MRLTPFSIARVPRIEFGSGVAAKLPALISTYGTRALLVTGGQSLRASMHWQALLDGLTKHGVAWEEIAVHEEPSPQFVDEAAQRFRTGKIDVVAGIGGGSVLDAAKAIAGLIPVECSVMDYLEGVGPERPYAGMALPFIAVPTTAGTGSEATKNAVLSVHGHAGFKKSFRHEQLVPHYAVVDPDLLASCPPELIAANGMDALTQLLESYVSSKANAFTDALAWSGLEATRSGLLRWYEHGAAAKEAHAQMAYAALLSGITLAQVGLGSVHGLAAPLGAFFPIPHGVVCGTLVAAATGMNIRALTARAPAHPALEKYAAVGALLTGKTFTRKEDGCAALVETLSAWTVQLNLPKLRAYGVTPNDYAHIVKHCRGSSMKTNPIVLTDREVEMILEQRT